MLWDADEHPGPVPIHINLSNPHPFRCTPRHTECPTFASANLVPIQDHKMGNLCFHQHLKGDFLFKHHFFRTLWCRLLIVLYELKKTETQLCWSTQTQTSHRQSHIALFNQTLPFLSRKRSHLPSTTQPNKALPKGRNNRNADPHVNNTIKVAQRYFLTPPE